MTFRRRLASGLLTTSVVAAIFVSVPAGVTAAVSRAAGTIDIFETESDKAVWRLSVG